MARTAAARSALPEWIRPQLTQLVSEAPDGDQWLHEIKYDGYRMHARLDRGAVKLLTRTGLDWTHKYPLALGARPMAPSNIDLIYPVYPVSISLGFAENCAMLPLQVDPCDRKRVVLGVAAKAKGEGVPDRDPGRQADVLISPAGRGDKPTAAFRQHPRGPRCDGLDIAGCGSTETIGND
jgi:hypothetical protein